MTALFEAHRALLEDAIAACRTRGFWTPFSEVPKSYGEQPPIHAKATFEFLTGKPFETGQQADTRLGAEVSPFGLELGITYPALTVETLIARAEAAGQDWALADIEARTGVALEILTRLNAQSFLMAHAVQHTTGQAFAMAFQAGGPHAQDRGLEAVARAYGTIAEAETSVVWDKPMGRTGSITLDKQFIASPRGTGLVIGCATFPTWNSYPAIFADLVTGNCVIVKPHPASILPLAITVKIARDVLTEQGFDPDVIQLAPDTVDAPLAKDLAIHPAIGIVDFIGSPAFGRWLRENVRSKPLYTEEAGINTIVIAETDAFAAACANIAFSLSLYSGQMCTAPQAIFVPREGIATDQGHKSLDDVQAGIVGAIDTLLSDPARAAGVLGAIQNPATLERVAAARELGTVLRDSAPLELPGARTASPLLLAVDARDEGTYLEERFGPISFIIACDDAWDAVRRAAGAAKAHGGITAALYAKDAGFIADAARHYARAGVPLSVNLTGNIYVNQSAAFSDYHVSGANPAGNACVTDAAFIAGRFCTIGIRQPAA